jgi:hypothetical protein
MTVIMVLIGAAIALLIWLSAYWFGYAWGMQDAFDMMIVEIVEEAPLPSGEAEGNHDGDNGRAYVLDR